MSKPDIIVVGASAGGVEALILFITCLPEAFDGSVFIVLHIPPYSPSSLPEILGRCNRFKAVHPQDGDRIEKEMIYIAPPNHHLLIEKNTVLVKKGPKENRFRPSIDALFRSAAYTYGPCVIGIIMSGVLDDGTSGMWTVKRLGGLAIIQDPQEAMHPEMPLNVQEYVDVDYCLPVGDICKLVGQLEKRASKKVKVTKKELETLAIEINIAKHDNAFSMGIIDKGKLTSFTCPECHGALVRLEEGKIIRFRCHTGHAYTASALLASLTQNIEETLWASMRAVEECSILLGKLKEGFKKVGHARAAAFFGDAEKEHRKRARVIHETVFAQKIFSSDMRFAGKARKLKANGKGMGDGLSG